MSPWFKKNELSNREVAQILEDFLSGIGSQHAWDDFTLGMSFDDERLERIRKRCVGLTQEFPPDNPHEYCNEKGLSVIREFIRELREPA